MKNFSTRALRSLAVPLAISWAALLTAAAAQAATGCGFRPNAPDQHVVAKGDTLWDISGAFLERPWCWPQVWDMNRDDIRNPHWIYPGQVIYFDRARGRLTLTRPGAAGAAREGAGEVTRLQPQVRSESLYGGNAVPAIPAGAIEPFLTQPLLVEPAQLAAAPRIAAAREERTYVGDGDRVYVRGDLGSGPAVFQVFRPGKALVDPDTGKTLAHEAQYLGTARLAAAARPGVDVHSVDITGAIQEIAVGDRLLPMPAPVVLNYVPHAPQQPVRARVVALAGESRYAAQNQVVAVNRGTLDGLDVGAVLQLYHSGQSVPDPASHGFLGFGKAQLRLPDEPVGNLFIFRVFGHVAYGLVMQATAPVQAGDVATSPE
jgi:nucleoid-associated protein YgaU